MPTLQECGLTRMPVAEDRLYSPRRLNRWFAVSSLLMSLSLFWLIFVDYDRPWRKFQDNYFLGKAALAHLDYLDATRQERVNEIAQAKQRLQDSREFTEKSKGVERTRLTAERVDADLAFRAVDGPYGRLRQVLDVTKDTYERAKEQHGPDHSATKEAHKELRAQEEELESLRKDAEKWEDKLREIDATLKSIDKPIKEEEGKVRELEQVAIDAARKDQSFRGVLWDTGLLAGLPLVKAIINAPLGDFTAPMNTPGRHQINQVVLPDVRQRLNYLETYTTDRCATCHVAIQDPDFSKERLTARFERSLTGINEQLQRMGKQPLSVPAPPASADGRAIPPGRVAEHWNEVAKKQQDEYFDTLLALVNGYLKQSGRKTIELHQPLLAHPDLDLYLTVDSPHPNAKMGCTVCHEGNPQETDFVLAAHSPPTHHVEEVWKEKYYVTAAGVPGATFETIEHYWDRAMRLPEHTEAGCAKCHSHVTDIDRYEGKRVGERLNLGQHLFREVGCINCHSVDSLKGSRRVGPDLRRVASKLKPEFVQPWAFFPQKFRPSTTMPHFFMQENSRTETANAFDPDPVTRTEAEVAAITHYLFTLSEKWEPLVKPAEAIGDAERGRQLFRSVGCTACHANLAEFGEEWITKDLMHREALNAETATHRYKGMTHEQRVVYAREHFADSHDTFLDPDAVRFDPDKPYTPPIFTRFAPELSGIASKVTAEWMYSWLMNPTHFSPDTKMPSLRLAPEEAADLAAYLTSPAMRNDAFVQKTFEMNDARRKMVDDLIFGILSSQRSEKRSRAVMEDEGGELTQMIVESIKSAKPVESVGATASDRSSTPSIGPDGAQSIVKSMSLQDKKLTFLGSKMILHYGCYACHNIRGFEETTPPGTDLSAWAEKPVTQLDFAFYDNAFHDMRHERKDVFGYIYPPDAKDLRQYSPLPDDAQEEITHTHHAFAKHKLENPRIWDRNKLKRPLDKLKMPNFYFTEHEAEALTTYLLSRIPPRVRGPLLVDYERTNKGPIAEGRSLVRELNCLGCHELEDNVPTVQQYFRREVGGQLRFDEVNAPPSLRGEGAKLQHQWFHQFLSQVEPLRPWLQVRMPSFNLTGEQRTQLVRYFAALSKEDSRVLEARLRPVHAALETEKENSADEAKMPASAKTGEKTASTPWYAQDNLRRSAESLRRWAVERRLMRPADVDMLKNTPERLADSHKRLLHQVEFVQKLYSVEYPFTEPPSPLSPPARFETGTHFLNDMGCLKCHVLGNMLPGPAKTTDEFVQVYRLDGVRGEGESALAILNGKPYKIGSTIDGHTLVSASTKFYDSGDIETKAIVEGPGPDGKPERVLLQAASAPNLGLSYERLRRDWVVQWMLEPNLIQPGTKMPQNFPDGKSPFEGDAKYPGTSRDQMELLVDAIYDSGRTNARVPLVKTVVKEQTEEFQEDGGGGFED